MVYALNKSDLLKMNELKKKSKYLNLMKTKNGFHVSAKSGKNVNELKELIKD